MSIPFLLILASMHFQAAWDMLPGKYQGMWQRIKLDKLILDLKKNDQERGERLERLRQKLANPPSGGELPAYLNGGGGLTVDMSSRLQGDVAASRATIARLEKAPEKNAEDLKAHREALKTYEEWQAMIEDLMRK